MYSDIELYMARRNQGMKLLLRLSFLVNLSGNLEANGEGISSLRSTGYGRLPIHRLVAARPGDRPTMAWQRSRKSIHMGGAPGVNLGVSE